MSVVFPYVNMLVNGVKVVVGDNIKATPALTLRLGTASVRYSVIDKDGKRKTTDVKYSVVAVLDDVVGVLTKANIRSKWTELFCSSLEDHPLLIPSLAPAGGDVKVLSIRLNPTARLSKVDWNTDSVDIQVPLLASLTGGSCDYLWRELEYALIPAATSDYKLRPGLFPMKPRVLEEVE